MGFWTWFRDVHQPRMQKRVGRKQPRIVEAPPETPAALPGYYLLYGPFGRSPKTEPREHWGPFATRGEAQAALTAELRKLKKQGYDPDDMRTSYLIRRLTSDQYEKLLFPGERNPWPIKAKS